MGWGGQVCTEHPTKYEILTRFQIIDCGVVRHVYEEAGDSSMSRHLKHDREEDVINNLSQPGNRWPPWAAVAVRLFLDHAYFNTLNQLERHSFESELADVSGRPAGKSDNTDRSSFDGMTRQSLCYGCTHGEQITAYLMSTEVTWTVEKVYK